jgi:hypothetical protein
MTFAAADPIAFGQLYRVVEVAGHPPVRATDFVGAAEFSIEWHGSRHRVAGTGVPGSAYVLRFYEKDVDHDGKDVRTWDISTLPGGGFVAYQLAG